MSTLSLLLTPKLFLYPLLWGADEQALLQKSDVRMLTGSPCTPDHILSTLERAMVPHPEG